MVKFGGDYMMGESMVGNCKTVGVNVVCSRMGVSFQR